MAREDITVRFNLDESGFKNGIKHAGGAINEFRKEISGKVGVALAGMFSVGLIKNIVELGTAAAETASKFESVFGPASSAMNERVQELRKTIPSTTAEMQNSLATFAQMATAFGMNSTAANMFSVEMVKIAGDIASFNDLPIEDAFTKIQSAISGEFEPMKQLGIVINQARLKQEALNLQIYNGVGEMNAAQKALAVQSIMIRDMGNANGDAALTANSASNQIKFLKASISEVGTEIGVTALPAVLELARGISWLLEKTKEFTDFAGSTVGEMIYGPTEETLKRQRESKQLFDAQAQATRELTSEGKLYNQGMFEGSLWTKGLSEKLDENKRKIKERTQLIIDGLAKEGKASEKNEDDRVKRSEKEIKEASDLTGELKEQIKAETNPARKAALEERLLAYQALLKAAGELNGIETAKPKGPGAIGEVPDDGGEEAPESQSKYEDLVKPVMEEIEETADVEGKKAGSVYATSFFDEFEKEAERATSDVLKDKLKDIEKQAAELRRAGDHGGSNELLNTRFGIRREVNEARSDERIDRIGNGYGDNERAGGSNNAVSDYETKSLELQTNIKDLMDPISKHYGDSSTTSLQRDSFQSQIDLYKLTETQSVNIQGIVERLDKLDRALR